MDANRLRQDARQKAERALAMERKRRQRPEHFSIASDSDSPSSPPSPTGVRASRAKGPGLATGIRGLGQLLAARPYLPFHGPGPSRPRPSIFTPPLRLHRPTSTLSISILA